MAKLNSKDGREKLQAMITQALDKNSESRRRTQTQREIVSSDQEDVSPKVSDLDFYPFDPSYLFTGMGSVSNYKKKRFARLRNSVSLVG